MMANNYSNVMDGSRLAEQNIYTCRLCLKQFLYYSDYAFHERMHFEQVPLPGSLQGGLRPAYDNHVVPPYNSAASTPGTLDSFDKLIQPFRSTIPETDLRSQTDTRGLVPSSQQDLRNYVPSSPADHRNMAVTSPADPRNMVATSPGDPRNMVASSPADPRNLIPSSPADTRNMVPSSPADPRNLVPASPVDPRNLVPASPVDPRNLVPASPVDPRNMVPASPVDPRNMVPASPVDPRNMVPASPVDPRNMVPASPAAQQDPRNLMVSSPASLPDKSTQQLYRSDIEGQNINLGSRSTPINIQSPSISMATVPMSTDVRLLPIDTRPLQSQVSDSRLLPGDNLTYSSSSFLDSLTRSLYTPDLTNKPMSTPPFSTLPMCRPEDILGLDNRQHPIQKPDPYYGIPKSIYHQSSGQELADSYSSNQYGLGKLLSPQQGTYYQQNMSSQPQTLYGIDKLTSTPLNYYNQPNNNEKSTIEQRDTVPKQTLHYGPSVPSLSTPNHSQYQHSIPRSDQQHTNPSQHKVPASTEQLPAYQSGHASPHLTYSQVHKGSQPQAQVYAPVPSHALPSQHDYKLSTEPVPTVNLAPKQPPSQEIMCYICQAPFSNMAEMSEHMKIHAQGMVSQNRHPATSQQQNFPTSAAGTMSSGRPVSSSPGSESLRAHLAKKQVSPVLPQGNHVKTKDTYPAKAKYSVPEKTKDISPPKSKDSVTVSCSVCGKSFLKQAFLIEHMKVHTSPQQYECKVCGKVFKKKSKCTRHEALHSRDIHLYYCEICDKNFEQKGKYLHHIQKQHTEQDSVRIHQHREHQAGTKKAVPLTGGSIDTTFERVEVEKYIDCQICDEEIEKVKLVAHLKSHDVHSCDKCDQVFLQKTECVEHLMSQHRKELANTKSDDERESPKKKSPVKIDSKKTEEPVMGSDTKSEVSGIIGKVNKSRKEVIKDLKEKKKEVMKNLKEKQKAIRDLEKLKKVKEKKVKTELNSQDEKVKGIEDIKKGKSKNDSKLNMTEVKLKFSCSKCEMSFANKSDLSVHVQTHVKDPTRIYCEVCDYSYHAKEKGYYIYHMKYHRDHELINSTQPAQIPCTICYTNIDKETFVTHVKRVHSQYSCDICQWSYSSENSLVKHMRSIHGGKKYKNYVYDESHYIEDIVEPAPTPEPPVVYKKLKDVKAEQQTVEKKPTKLFTCTECNNRSFTKKQNYERHLKTHNKSIEEPQIVCELCQASLDSRGTYIYHLQQHAVLEITAATGVKVEKSEDKVDEKLSIDDKNKNVESKITEINIKDDKMNKPESKEEVNETSDAQKEMSELETEKVKKPAVKQTLITVLNPETGDFEEKLIEETDEPEITIDLKIFEEDLNNDEEDDKVEETDEKEKTKNVSEVVVGEIIYCRLCNKCVKRNTLSEHMRTHLTYSCNTCQYAFMKKQRYIDHQRALHLSELIAEEIEKFEHVENMVSEEPANNETTAEQKEKDLHRRKRSTKILNCPLCTSEFRQDKYVEHLKSHEKHVLICQFCERSFSKKNILAIHEKSHQTIAHDELPYPKLCPVCEISMKSRKMYMNHITEHSKKVVTCKICEEMFTSEKVLDNHVKICHDPHMKVYWKEDGEGLKFDTKTGRIHEVCSDYISEIKELNDLCKQFGKPPIWLTAPKKVKDKSLNVSKMKEMKESSDKVAEVSESVETSESDEKVKSETSDEDYVPERSLRKRKSGKVTESDDVEDDDYESEESKPSKKKKRTSRYASDDSVSEENYKPKSTRTRHLVVKKDLLKQKIKKLKQTAGRVLRSTIESKTEKKAEKANLKKTDVKRKAEDESKSSSPKKKRSELDNLSFEEVEKVKRTEEFPEKCPECGIAQFSLSSYKEHARIHTGNMPFKCPVCEQTFTRACNMLTHVKHRHKEYSLNKLKKNMKKVTDSNTSLRTLRNREKSPDSKPGTPVSSSTPIRGSRLVVQLSPINVEERKRNITSKSKDSVKKSPDKKILETIEKKSEYKCDVCKKKFTQRWNYAQHIQGHKREGKKKEKETKTVATKKDAKKKDKESKPFSCKDCSESFKKKRDLYIHTKIHSTDEDDISDKAEPENLTTSINTSVDSATSDKLYSSVDMTESFTDRNGKIDESKCESNNSSRYESEEMSTDLNLGDSLEIDTETYSLVKKNKKQSVKEQIMGKNGTKDESGNGRLSKTDKGSVSGTSVDTVTLGKDEPSKVEKESNTKTAAIENNKDSENIGCEMVKEISVPQNNNDDHSKSGDSDSEKAKFRSQPSVNKMSAETAVSKWKAKVSELLSSQLALHATKQQEELANPEIKRVKEYLSISGKGEKHKFECRICGDSTCDQESTFRNHMDVHLNEPPPHCSICDIYFMAIYPKRRLAEHNKKKHPELNS